MTRPRIARALARAGVGAGMLCGAAFAEVPGPSPFDIARHAAPSLGATTAPETCAPRLSGDEVRRVCPELARAARELSVGRSPEAAARALRAESVATSAEGREWARLWRALALDAGHRSTEARALLVELEVASAPSIRAASLRARAVLALRAGDAAEAAALHRRAASSGVGVETPVAARIHAAESFLAAGELAEADRALEAAASAADPSARGLVEIRRADVAFALGRRDEALRAYDFVARTKPGSPASGIAALRLRDIAPDTQPGARDALPSAPPGLDAYARLVAARTEEDAGRPDGALARLEPIREEDLSPALRQEVRDARARALRALARGDGRPDACERLLVRAGRDFADLARRSGAPDAEGALAACARANGLRDRGRGDGPGGRTTEAAETGGTSGERPRI